MARLPRLIGRGRALEVFLGADDFPGDLAERYGYVTGHCRMRSWMSSWMP
jgi:enoyl-CoA hydratase/carnithine racemase